MLRLLSRPEICLRVLARSAPFKAGTIRLESTDAKPRVVSSVAAGTVLKGCNVRKSGSDPVAKEDSEYPDWLWEVLDPEIQRAKLEADPILFARKQRREANRKKIKEQNFIAKLGS